MLWWCSRQVWRPFSTQSRRQFSFRKASRLPFIECGSSMQFPVKPSDALRSGWEECQMPPISFSCIATSFNSPHNSCTCVGLCSTDRLAWLINIWLVPINIAWLQYWNWIWHWLTYVTMPLIKIPLACVVRIHLRSKFVAQNRQLRAPPVILEALNSQSVRLHWSVISNFAWEPSSRDALLLDVYISVVGFQRFANVEIFEKAKYRRRQKVQERRLRDHPLSMYADFPAFWTPSPPLFAFWAKS